MKKTMLEGTRYTPGIVKIFGIDVKKIKESFAKKSLEAEIIRILNKTTKKTNFRQLNTEVFEDKITILADGQKIISFEKENNRTKIFFNGFDPRYDEKKFIMNEFLKLRNRRGDLIEEFYQRTSEIRK